MRDALREALTTKEKGPKVLIAQSECQLNRQRRIKPLLKKAIADGERVVRERFGVDPDTCTGDHSCIRLSGCPSLSIAPRPALRKGPVATVLDSSGWLRRLRRGLARGSGCAFVHKESIVRNPSAWDPSPNARAARDRLAAASRK